MTRLLIIGYVWPEPDSSAAGSRMMQLMALFLQQQWQITFASPAADSEHMADIESLGVNRVRIELNNSSFDRFISECRPDIVMFDRFMMEEQFGWRVQNNCPQALRILESSDLHSLRHARQLAHKQRREVSLQDFHGDMAKREIASILRSDLTLIISEWELEHLSSVYRVDRQLLHYIPFMLDPIQADTPSRQLPTFSQRQHFIFIGNFHHAPNWDAVLYLQQDIWPLIRQQLAQAELHIYGAYTPDKARQLHKPAEGFYISGWAQDVGEVMKQARVCLAPLRFGAGIKGKLVDAMQYGTPSVTSSIGAEGMHADMPWSGVIEDDAEAFAAAATRLYQQESLWDVAQENGFRIINKCYNKKDLGQALINKIMSVRENLDQHRLENFTGAMLTHHTMRSTEYMSRWIEEKNKLK
jgi:glycosyltransferase involved in cell wall biosynthesis